MLQPPNKESSLSEYEDIEGSTDVGSAVESSLKKRKIRATGAPWLGSFLDELPLMLWIYT
jgi:hypothetical protein